MDNRLDTHISSSIENLNNTNIETKIPFEFQSAVSQGPAPFTSRYKSWIKAIALAILLVFIPEQISWAFNYDPKVLWGHNQIEFSNKHEINPVLPQQDLTAAAPETISAHIADSVKSLLTQIANKPNTRIQINLSDRSNFSTRHPDEPNKFGDVPIGTIPAPPRRGRIDLS